MSRAQRITFLAIAAVIAAVAVLLLTSGAATTDTAQTPTSTPTPAAQQEEASPGQATPEPTPTPDPVTVLEPGELTRFTVTEGDTVRVRIRSDEPDEVHIHGYDRYVDVGPGRPGTDSFEATITGVFELEYHSTGEQIGQLSVQPR